MKNRGRQKASPVPPARAVPIGVVASRGAAAVRRPEEFAPSALSGGTVA